MKFSDFQGYIKQYESEIRNLEAKLFEVKNKYYLERLFAKGFFIDEYNNFKERTGKILIATYLGGSSMDVNNYSFKIVDKNYKMSSFDKEFKDDCVFEQLIIELYNDKQFSPTHFDFLLEKIFNVKI